MAEKLYDMAMLAEIPEKLLGYFSSKYLSLLESGEGFNIYTKEDKDEYNESQHASLSPQSYNKFLNKYLNYYKRSFISLQRKNKRSLYCR